MLGLGFKAGNVIVGTEKVRAAIKKGSARMVVVAADHGERVGDKVVRLAKANDVPVAKVATAEELGRGLGRYRVTVVGIMDEQLAHGIMRGIAD